MPDLIDLPQKSLFKIQGKDIKKRQLDLNRYLNSLVYRPNILNTSVMQQFLKLDQEEQAMIQDSYVPQVVEEINFLSMPITDYVFLPEEQGLILVSARAKSAKSSLMNYLTDRSLLNKFKWKKGGKKQEGGEKEQEQCQIPPQDVYGAVLVYGPDERGSYVSTSKLDFRHGVTACAFQPRTRHLLIGFACGIINLMHFNEKHVLTSVGSLRHH